MLFLIVILVVIVVVVHQFATTNATKIKGHADIYPYEVLSQNPKGTEEIIVSADGTKIHTVSAGQGATVILAHGYAFSILEWNVIFEKLVQAGYHVIAFDQRGHGKSSIGTDGIGSRQMASDYKTVLEHFDVRKGILVGHSMGGFLSMIFMLTYPDIAKERLKGVVLMATTAGNVLEGSPQNRVQIPLMRMGIIQAVTRSDVYGWLFGASLYGDNPSPAGIRVFREEFLRQNHAELIPILEALANEDYYARLGEIQIPSVVIGGKQDKTTPPWHSERIGKTIPNARMIWIEHMGHLLNWEAPDTIVQAVQQIS